MKTEIINPNVNNFVNSLRDVGYTFEIAVADVIDNSITAKASEILIYAVPTPEMIFCLYDNGIGMSELELTEAMRLASKNPNDIRNKDDLGRFGLGLKTASFSQCKKLTVISKKNNKTSLKQWDLDYISESNSWLLITPNIIDYKEIPFLKELDNSESGTIVIWENIDKYKAQSFGNKLDDLRKHLALVFHRFLESHINIPKIKIIVNNNQILPFNPFNINHTATIEKATEEIQIFNSKIFITPYILPHHSKLSRQEWEKYATENGYVKSQGFYLYRANRLLIYGTWWGLHRATDAHKLVRIKIDISNQQDKYWGIDIKKSTANPKIELKRDLKRIILNVTKQGSRPFTGRGRKINDKTTTRFWNIIPNTNDFHFGINRGHPIYRKLCENLSDENIEMLNFYLKGLEAYLPLESIQSSLQQTPHQIKQKTALSPEEVSKLVETLKQMGLSSEYIDELLKTEIFKNQKELLIDEKLS